MNKALDSFIWGSGGEAHGFRLNAPDTFGIKKTHGHWPPVHLVTGETFVFRAYHLNGVGLLMV